MLERYEQGKLSWVSLKNPTTEEIQDVMVKNDIPPGLLTDLTTPIPQSLSVVNGHTVKITLDFPIVKRADIQHPHEIKFIIAKNSLITVQYEDMEATDRFKRQFEIATTLHKTPAKLTGVHLFLALMHELYAVMGSKLDYLESKLADIEGRVSQHEEKRIIIEIAQISKKMISFRHVLRTHDDVLNDARRHFDEAFQNSYDAEMEKLYDSYSYLLRRLTSLFETLSDLRDTNFALLTTKQNDIMKILTIMAFVTFPLSLLTSTFGMNTEATPIVGAPGDFWIIVSIMFTATICFFVFFKYKHWM